MIANDKKTHLDTKKSTRDECFFCFVKIAFFYVGFCPFLAYKSRSGIVSNPFWISASVGT